MAAASTKARMRISFTRAAYVGVHSATLAHRADLSPSRRDVSQQTHGLLLDPEFVEGKRLRVIVDL